jgi:hypothetical protein
MMAEKTKELLLWEVASFGVVPMFSTKSLPVVCVATLVSLLILTKILAFAFA